MRVMRPAAGAAIVAAAALALSGCSMFGGDAKDPERDETTGEITAAEDEADVFSLRVGDCLDSADMTGDITTVAARPCSEVHDSEVYASTLMTDASYPGEDAIAAQAETFCIAEFETFVGLSFDASGLDAFPIGPTQSSWDEFADREILCIIQDSAGGLTATLAGAAR